MSHDIDTAAVLLHELRELNKRTIRLETRLFRLAKAMGHEGAMHEDVGRSDGSIVAAEPAESRGSRAHTLVPAVE